MSRPGESEESECQESSESQESLSDSSTETLPHPVFYKNEIICNKYRVLNELGKGGCGVVLSVVDIDTEGSSRPIYAAMKAETIDPKGRASQTIKVEAHVLRRLQNCDNFCRLFLCCRLDTSINIMVMSLVGKSLSWLRRHTEQQRFSISTSVRISLKCLEVIKELHRRGFLHRDIKASNFAIGAFPHDFRKIYLLDFGFARSYLMTENNQLKIRPPRKRAPYLGTDRYCSVNVHLRGEHGRVDDLWSFLFMLVEFILGKLPWKNIENKKLAKAKTHYIETFLKNCPMELWKFMRHLQKLKYDSRPDYNLLQNCLEEICHRKTFKTNDPFDWEDGGSQVNIINKAIEEDKNKSLDEMPSHLTTSESEIEVDS
ncbi:unnamed protein product [Bursaphelenchus xylophilus]|uniref:(pine wood nematode) hypothetical protein n=1 Tax=Bursaphelenchus xylophilus TaxID=6326 RepID=A0A1I7RQ23_BURXY|nr:unnamed protein product [Bursaphelenchus xylophilus]CAG9097024.1 unnamed protein product [Bursaphelenchus xylophilus]